MWLVLVQGRVKASAVKVEVLHVSGGEFCEPGLEAFMLS